MEYRVDQIRQNFFKSRKDEELKELIMNKKRNIKTIIII